MRFLQSQWDWFHWKNRMSLTISHYAGDVIHAIPYTAWWWNESKGLAQWGLIVLSHHQWFAWRQWRQDAGGTLLPRTSASWESRKGGTLGVLCSGVSSDIFFVGRGIYPLLLPPPRYYDMYILPSVEHYLQCNLVNYIRYYHHYNLLQ